MTISHSHHFIIHMCFLKNNKNNNPEIRRYPLVGAPQTNTAGKLLLLATAS